MTDSTKPIPSVMVLGTIVITHNPQETTVSLHTGGHFRHLTNRTQARMLRLAMRVLEEDANDTYPETEDGDE